MRLESWLMAAMIAATAAIWAFIVSRTALAVGAAIAEVTLR